MSSLILKSRSQEPDVRRGLDHPDRAIRGTEGKRFVLEFVVDVVFLSIIRSYRRPIPRTLRDRQATHRSVTHRS